MRLLCLQVLRFVAAASVFLHHASAQYKLMGGGHPAYYWFERWGFFGVDIFFVLSGYIMWCTSARGQGTSDAWRFLLRRFLRIFLGYWPILLPVSLFYWSVGHTGGSFWNSVFLWENGDLILTVAWSLRFELSFYAFFAFLLWLPSRRLRPLFTALVVLGMVGASQYGSQSVFALNPFLFEFIAGLVLAAYRHKLGTRVGLVGALGLLYIGFVVGTQGPYPHGLARVATFGASASGIVLFAALLDDRALVRPPAWLVALGDSSYSFYLWHIPVLDCFYYLGGISAWSQWPIVGSMLVFCVSLSFSHLWSHFVEIPLYEFSLRRLAVGRPGAPLLSEPGKAKRRVRPFFVLLAASVGILFVGPHALPANKLAARLERSAAQPLSIAYGDGRRFAVSGSGIVGYVDAPSEQGDDIVIPGWAYDSSGARAPIEVLLFVDDVLIRTAAFESVRDDVTKALGVGRELTLGFEARVPKGQLFLVGRKRKPTLIAVASDGRAGILMTTPPFDVFFP